ncbi:hypothetical protein IJ556_06165 [bacterium]|nr:hypothetical protein [bacterium]
MISLEKTISIAKKEFGQDMKLYEKCQDIEGAYAFSATPKDGIPITGLVLLVDKETGETSYEQYIPLPGYRLAELTKKGHAIDISKMI